MRVHALVILLLCALMTGCGGSNGANFGGGGNPPPPPVISSTAAQNGAVIVKITPGQADLPINYTTDGTTPKTGSSPIYFAPFLVASNVTVKAVDTLDFNTSNVASQSFSPNILSGTLVWSDEFTNNNASNAQPDPAVWTYDTGTNCCGNNELEDYCAWNSSVSPCDPANPSTFVGTDGYLHILARSPAANVYTSARLKSQALFSFQYGRIEASMKLPEAQGMWPAFWMLGNNIATINWPACGELDIMEHIDGNNPPPYYGGPPPGYDWIAGSVHGGTSSTNEINGGQTYHAPGFSAADWHIYGLMWSKGQIQYYVDNPANIYATFTPTNSSFNSTTWPFDQGPQFIILNLAVGGDWPGPPDSTTIFPQEMLVDYVRIYTN